MFLYSDAYFYSDIMSMVEFSDLERLKKLQSKIKNSTKISLSLEEILELGLELLEENFEMIVARLNRGNKKLSQAETEKLFDLISDWGEGTEDSSENIDEYLYGGSK